MGFSSKQIHLRISRWIFLRTFQVYYKLCLCWRHWEIWEGNISETMTQGVVSCPVVRGGKMVSDSFRFTSLPLQGKFYRSTKLKNVMDLPHLCHSKLVSCIWTPHFITPGPDYWNAASLTVLLNCLYVYFYCKNVYASWLARLFI